LNIAGLAFCHWSVGAVITCLQWETHG